MKVIVLKLGHESYLWRNTVLKVGQKSFVVKHCLESGTDELLKVKQTAAQQSNWLYSTVIKVEQDSQLR